MPGRPRKGTAPGATSLPSGRNGLSREYVAANQRARIRQAIAAAVNEHGYSRVTIEQIIDGAGVSRRTFYDHFKTKDEAYLAAYDDAATQLFDRIAGAYLAASAPEERLRECLRTFLEYLSAEPELARMCIVDVLAAGEDALDRRDEHMKRFAMLFDKAAEEMYGHPLPPLTAEGLVGGVYEVVYKRVLQRQADTLPDLLGDLFYFCLVPFLGAQSSHERHQQLVSRSLDAPGE
jgi:AcrR family transcriptional regulator